MSKNIGKYYYDEKNLIGQGSFGKVYKGIDSTNNQSVAIKVSSKKNVRKEVLDILNNEINIAKQLNHPHLVKTYDVYEHSDYQIVVMEFCQNDLKHTIQTKQLSELDVHKIIHQLILGFKELVRLGLLHRDIKPANCYEFDGIYKLGDFGSMIVADYSGKKLMKQEFGTLAYECPQMLAREKYTTKCDIWSLGILIYELLFNQTPWIGQSQTQYLRIIKTWPLRFPNIKNISKECKDFIICCLQISEKDRYNWDQIFEHPWLHSNIQQMEKLNEQQITEKLINHINIIARDQGININQTFKNYDIDDSGQLDYIKFERFIIQFDPRITSEEITLIFKYLDSNKKYHINQQQFSKLFLE